MSSRVISAAMLLLVACSTAADGNAGFETGPCVEGSCFDGLECLSDLCVEPEDVDDDDGPGGGFVDTGLSDSASSQPGTSDPAESGSGNASDPTAPTSLTTNQTSNDATTDESADSADELPPDDDSTTGTTGFGSTCGNGDVDAGEQCDGSDLQGFDCASLGLGGGTLECDPITCTFDTSMCVSIESGTTG
jgi:hypothetical protein